MMEFVTPTTEQNQKKGLPAPTSFIWKEKNILFSMKVDDSWIESNVWNQNLKNRDKKYGWS